MAFTTNLSGTTQVDDSVVALYDQSFIVESAQSNVMDQLVQYKAEIGAKSIAFPKFSQLSLATTPLTETDDVTSEALADAPIILTPAEYGRVVTTTSLASLQTGGKVDLAAVQLVGQNMARTKNKLATLALDASTNIITPSAKATADILAGDVLSGTILNQAYNKLSRKNIARINGEYILVAHDDVIADLRADTSAGGWVDVTKYAAPGETLANEVGMFKGFRVVRNNEATYGDQSGAGTVDVYNSYVLGFNALGLAESKTPGMVATGPFDKLARFVNLGWYGVFNYGIIDTDAVWKIQTASSLGANAS
jgi:N4-gp56 family major capsid protein